jgi:hypothetical protein
MKRRTRLLKQTAIESLTLAIEAFNRPSPTARTQGVLLHLQHGFEMAFKAAIWEERGEIQPKSGGNSYSYKECLGILRGLGELSEDEAVVAATIGGHRDGVQHQGAAVSEERLYLDAASGLRLFDDFIDRCFGKRLADYPEFAARMLPVSVHPPRELFLLTSGDIQRVCDLLKKPKHRHAEALAHLRTLVISDQAATNPLEVPRSPTEKQLMRVAKKLQETEDWTKVLPGLARLSLAEDEGMTYNLRIVKSKDAAPVRVVRPGEDGVADAASILKVAELDYWCFQFTELVSRAGITWYEGEALVFLLRLKDDEDCFKIFKLGKQDHGRYSGRALSLVRDAKAAGRMEEAKAALSHDRRVKLEEKKGAS